MCFIRVWAMAATEGKAARLWQAFTRPAAEPALLIAPSLVMFQLQVALAEAGREGLPHRWPELLGSREAAELQEAP